MRHLLSALIENIEFSKVFGMSMAWMQKDYSKVGVIKWKKYRLENVLTSIAYDTDIIILFDLTLDFFRY